ncbi:carbonic anhydrase [Caldibacillus lycopersici]|uniref:carbonic anhydrase n=1 Tax=Perspicuibacillus lycopersici TaxID=1325689 RepID=A0AAE3IX35_9BACI|nr:carbonic anhydrase [Perspicuibacillus lycopersici]MCU9614504.1 carbonic anhydrase [Perspicuibacillus lycopersici]
MPILHEILDYNKKFVEEAKYEKYETDKYPNKRIVILTCMDTRLQELLPEAMNLKNGDAKILRNAGAMITSPFGSIMRSILVAIYSLKAEEVFVIGHHDCGMSAMNNEEMTAEMKKHGISEETLQTLTTAGIPLDQWFTGFTNVEDSVKQSVDIIKNHPLLAKDIPVHGLVIDPATGKLDVVVEGYEN